MINIARHIDGIFLNDYEFLLDEKGNVMDFETEEQAKDYLRKAGCTEEEIYYMRFLESEGNGNE